MTENQNKPTQKPGEQPTQNGDQGKVSIFSDAKFWVAIVLIVGMLIILIIAAAQEQYSDTTELSAIFSGWITSIVAFYFYTNSNTQAQAQVKASAKSEAEAHTKADSALQGKQRAEKKLANIAGIIKGGIRPQVTEADKAKAAQVAQENIEKIKAVLEQEEF